MDSGQLTPVVPLAASDKESSSNSRLNILLHCNPLTRSESLYLHVLIGLACFLCSPHSLVQGLVQSV